MDMIKVADGYRMSQWAQVIQERQSSGQSIKDFCLRSGISRNTYFYWQRKLREAVCSELKEAKTTCSIVPGGWMQLKSKQTEQQTEETLVIEINGCHVTANGRTSPELLEKVCRTLRVLG